ncbi:SLC13 family permease [Pseudoroseomonas wenyumeiae]
MLLPGLLTAGTIGLWAASRLPEYLTALLFFAIAMILGIAPAEVVFSGFLSSAFWLVLSGFVLGVAIRKVGLADRAARLLAAHLSGSWPRMVGGVVLLTYALAFVMPSNMGRITLLMPVVMALADRAGLAEGGRGRIGLALAVGFGTFQLSASILPANVPNLIMAGAAERAYGAHFTYLSYLLLHAPVLGLLKGAVLTGCISALFPATPRKDIVAEAPGRSAPPSAAWACCSPPRCCSGPRMPGTASSRPGWASAPPASACCHASAFSAAMNSRPGRISAPAFMSPASWASPRWWCIPAWGR